MVTATLTKQQLFDYAKGSNQHPLDSFLERGYVALDYGVLTPSGDIIEQSEDYRDFCAQLTSVRGCRTSKLLEELCEILYEEYPTLEINL